MAASQSSPSPPPTQSVSAGGGALISLFLESDLDTRLALSVAADSTIRGLKAQVAVEHAATFPDIGPVVVKSIQVLLKGTMYHLSDSMTVMSPFYNVKDQYFLHVSMAAAETNTHQCRDKDIGRSSGVLPPVLKDDRAWVTVHAHDVDPSSSSQRNTERKSTTVCPATDVGTREEDLLHSGQDRELGFVSGDKRMVIREEKLGEPHAMDDPSEEKDYKKARVTGSFDTSVLDTIRETNDSKTRDVENLDKLPLETSTNSRGVLSSTSCQQGVDGSVNEDSIKLENPIITRNNKKRKNNQSVTSKGVYDQELTESSTGAMEVPKATGEDLLHENEGDGASTVEMTSRDKTKGIPRDMPLSSSQQNTGSQVAKHVQLWTDADLAADQSKSAEGTNDLYHDESAVEAGNMEKGSKREDVLETIYNTSQKKNCKQSKKVISDCLNSMDAAEQISDLKDVLTENTAVPADGRTKAAKRQRNKVSLKHVPTDSGKAVQSLGEQVRNVPVEDLNEENCNKEDFMNSRAQQGPVIPEGSSNDVEANDYVAVHPDNDKINFIDHSGPSAMNEPSVSAKKNEKSIKQVKDRNKKKRKADMQSQHAGSIEPNDVPESHVHTDKTSLADLCDAVNVGMGMPSVSAQNLNRDGNVKKGKKKRDMPSVGAVNVAMGMPSDLAQNINKDGNVKKGKKKSKQKSDLVKHESLKTDGGNQGSDNCPQDFMQSDVQNGRVEQGNSKKNNDKDIRNDSMLQQDSEDATREITLEKKPHQSISAADSQTNLPIVKDYARMSKKQRNTSSHTKCHAKSRNHDGSVDERTSQNLNAGSNHVQSISMSPQALTESACGTPAVDQFRVAVRKNPRKKSEQAKVKSRKDIRKRETGKIFGDTISKSSEEVNTMGEKAVIENSSSTFADSAEEHPLGFRANTMESVGNGQRAAMLISLPNKEVSGVNTPNLESQAEAMRQRERRSKSNADRLSRRLALQKEVMVQPDSMGITEGSVLDRVNRTSAKTDTAVDTPAHTRGQGSGRRSKAHTRGVDGL